jgi:predicted Rossmann fold flavoprotein
MTTQRIVIVGGGAAGFFAAITAAEHAPGVPVLVLERSADFLTKVRISGGGRCNVTHACFAPQELIRNYPRGAAELLGPFHRFQPRDTVAWFEQRGVRLKTEADGRMFPVTDSSETIVQCLHQAARATGVSLRTHCGVTAIARTAEGFHLHLNSGETLECPRLLLAPGGGRGAEAGKLVAPLGHTLTPLAPSLFTFQIETSWLRALAGLSVTSVALTGPNSKLRSAGPLLITHWGLSGPAVLRLSAWGARELLDRNYQFPLHVNWVPEQTAEQLSAEFSRRRQQHGAKRVANLTLPPLPVRLWEALLAGAAIPPDTRWAALSRAQQHRLIRQLHDTELPVSGKSLNKEEFVTCGGIRLAEVNFQTMASRVCPGLYFAGEFLDVDGLTGGFNFQAAWTTGWLAGRALAATAAA